MPVVPKSIQCSELGCKEDRSRLNSYCLKHGGKNITDGIERRYKSAKYTTPAWRKLRLRQLSKQPLCQSCALRNRISLANEVDHVFPWSKLGNQSFNYNVFQSLCKECHSVKTGLEQKGIYRHYTHIETDYLLTDWLVITENHYSNDRTE
jgi:5-methylcytosine-specific restriction protein A